MKGTICTAQKCPICGGVLKYDDKRDGLFCLIHPDQQAKGTFFVRFGAKHTKRFGNDFAAAQRHLVGLRFKTDEGTFDLRDYQKNAPLALKNLAEQYITYREKTSISKSQLNEIKRVLHLAVLEWGLTNIKELGEGEIEDFLFRDFSKLDLKAKPNISNKTRHNYKSVLSTFWRWVVRREKRKSGIEMPEFPEIGFTLGFRNITDMKTQVKIIEEIKRISYHINPRLWLAALLSSYYTKIRPDELINIQEGHLLTNKNLIFIAHPKENRSKFVQISPIHSKLIEEHRNPRGLDHLPFFRHIQSRQGVKSGTKFGPNLLNKWWKRACKNLGIRGVTYYPGTKHTTVTELGKKLTPEQIKRGGTGHTSDAFDRYLIPSLNDAKIVNDAIFDLKSESGEQSTDNIIEFRKKEASNE